MGHGQFFHQRFIQRAIEGEETGDTEGQARLGPEMLGHIANAHVGGAHHRAIIGCIQAEQAVKQRGFACPIWAHNRDYLARADAERYFMQYLAPTVEFAYATRFE